MKNQIHRVLIIVMTLALTLCLTACGNNSHIIKENKLDQCYLLSDSNSNAAFAKNLTVAEENTWWNGISFTSQTAPTEKTITVAGKTYSGIYRKSRYELYNSFATDYYTGDNCMEFGINSNTGKLVSISLKTLDFYRKEPLLDDLDNPESILVNMAENYASEFIETSEYTMLEPRVRPYAPEGVTEMVQYTYTFARYINEIKTTDYISVQLTSKGNLASIIMGDIGKFAQDRTSAEINNFKSTDTLALLTSVVDQDTLQDFTIQDQCFAITPLGEQVLCVRATGSNSVLAQKDNTQETVALPIGLEFIIK